jgi:hypothetical protein
VLEALLTPAACCARTRSGRCTRCAASRGLSTRRSRLPAGSAQSRGEFSALAAAWSEYRDGDQITRGAFAASIAPWQASNKRVPLHWAHKGDPIEREEKRQQRELRRRCDRIQLEAALGFDTDLIKEIGL